MKEPILIPKAEANYSKDGGDSPCGSCKNFIPPNACGVVEGTISENGTCDMFTANESNAPGSQEDLMAQLFGGADVQ